MKFSLKNILAKRKSNDFANSGFFYHLSIEYCPNTNGTLSVIAHYFYAIS
jgi:hypothetical protein